MVILLIMFITITMMLKMMLFHTPFTFWHLWKNCLPICRAIVNKMREAIKVLY